MYNRELEVEKANAISWLAYYKRRNPTKQGKENKITHEYNTFYKHDPRNSPLLSHMFCLIRHLHLVKKTLEVSFNWEEEKKRLKYIFSRQWITTDIKPSFTPILFWAFICLLFLSCSDHVFLFLLETPSRPLICKYVTILGEPGLWWRLVDVAKVLVLILSPSRFKREKGLARSTSDLPWQCRRTDEEGCEQYLDNIPVSLSK